MRVFFLFPFLALIFCTPLVRADYRVFTLKITKPNADPTQPPTERIVQSNLDPDQYRGYYPVATDEKIVYIDSWRCTGRTDWFLDYCPKPARQPSAADNSSPQKAQIPDPNVSK